MHPGARTIAAGVLVFVSLAVFIPGVTEATLDTPQILSYQGRLTDAQKVTVADGAQSMKFAIFDASAGGTCLWSAGDDAGDGVDTTFSAGVDCPANVPSTAISVSVTDGLFNVLLGASPQNALPDSLFNTTSGQERWLEIRIGAETLTPRRRLVSSASALQAGNASLLDNFDTSQVGGSVAFVPVTDSSGNLVLTKNLTVDTSTLFVDSSNNRVGVGFLTGTADLSVTQDAVIQGVMSTTVEGKSVAISRTHATASTERTVSIQANLSPTGAGASIGALNVLAQSDPGTGTAISGISGGFLIGEHLGTGTATTVRGIFAQARSIGGTVTSLRGMDANALAFGASAVATDAIAIHGQVTIATSASVTNGYAILAKNTSFSSGTYTNQAGIAIEDQTVATNRTNLLVGTSTIPSGVYSIYNSSSSDNYFAGNVGIGTTAPGEKLVVSGGNISLPTAGSELKFTSTSIAGPTGYLRMRSNASGLTALAVMPNVTQGARNAILDFYNTDYSADATNYEALSFYSVGSGSYANITNAYTIGSKKGGTGSSRPLLFGHWNAGETTFDVGLSVATSGYVGVGTQNPSHRLSVADAVAGDTVPGSLRLEMTNSAAVGGNGLGFGTDYYIENSNGNINAVAQTQVVLDDATEGSEDASFRFRTRAAGGALTERVRIDSTGNVGVGTTAPNTALDINGAFSVRGIAAPAVSPAGQGRLYFDSTSNTFKISQNAGAYADIATTGTAFVNGGNSFAGTATLGTNDNNILAFET